MTDIETLLGETGFLGDEPIMVVEVEGADPVAPAVRWVNPAFTETLRYTLPELRDRGLPFLDGPEVDRAARGEIIAELSGGRAFSRELVVRRKDGARLWAQLTFWPVGSEARDWICRIRDMSERQLAERYRAMFDQTGAAVCLKSGDRYVMVNEAYAELFGTTIDALTGRVQSEALPNSRSAAQREIERRVIETGHSAEYELHLEARSMRLLVNLSRVRDPVLEQDLLCSIGTAFNTVRDAEDSNRALEALHRELEHASTHDALTGLPNRRALEQRLKGMSGGDAGCGKLAAIHIDLDRFKQINDAFGHAAGDHVLRHVARVLRELTRAGDFVARVGGDEFVVLYGAAHAAEGPGLFAARLIDMLNKPTSFQGQECRIGASIGLALSDSAADHDQLLINADIALYRAKKTGRNRWVMFTRRMQEEVLRNKALSDDLLRAIDRREFSTAYQPQFDARTLNVVGVEALLRWHHPERGVLHPTEFMPVAEELGVVGTIDQMVMHQTMENDSAWRSRGLTIPRIAINVSGRRLRDASLLSDIKAGGIAPERLSIEILESVFVDEEDEVLFRNIDRLREMGVDIELDDFGTGHSSVVGLIKLKPTRLKVDRHFVDQTLGTGQESALIRAIVEIGRSLNVMTVAEGVENHRQGELLARMGCDVLQGYGFAPPMAPDALEGFLRDQTLQGGRPTKTI